MPRARIIRSVLRPKREKNPRRQPEHLAFLRKLPCLACGKSAPSEAAHIRLGTDGAMGVKPSDRFSVPLCPGPSGCHATQHRIGEATFWSDAGLDPTPVAERLWLVSGNVEQGLRALERAWQNRGLRASA